MKDIFLMLKLTLKAGDQDSLNDLIKNISDRKIRFEVMDLNNNHIKLDYRNRLFVAVNMSYSGFDSSYDSRFRPSVHIHPMLVLTIPDQCLLGAFWIDEKIDFLRILWNGAFVSRVLYSDTALFEGMKNAILNQNRAALLILIWIVELVTGLDAKNANEKSFEPSAELFRLAVSMPSRSGDGRKCDMFKFISLFQLLLRAHAESMPKDDPVIMAWATHVRAWENEIEPIRSFGQWVLDFSHLMSNEYIENEYNGIRYLYREKYRIMRASIFCQGSIRPCRQDDEMQQRFIAAVGKSIWFEGEVEMTFPLYS